MGTLHHSRSRVCGKVASVFLSTFPQAILLPSIGENSRFVLSNLCDGFTTYSMAIIAPWMVLAGLVYLDVP